MILEGVNKLPTLLASILLPIKCGLKVCGCRWQLHRDLDGVRRLLHQRGLPQPRPRHLPQVRVQGPHPHGGTENLYLIRQNLLLKEIANFQGTNGDVLICSTLWCIGLGEALVHWFYMSCVFTFYCFLIWWNCSTLLCTGWAQVLVPSPLSPSGLTLKKLLLWNKLEGGNKVFWSYKSKSSSHKKHNLIF